MEPEKDSEKKTGRSSAPKRPEPSLVQEIRAIRAGKKRRATPEEAEEFQKKLRKLFDHTPSL